jgi:Na+-transporting NADH:ubiquinone oxidoreductase subunit C
MAAGVALFCSFMVSTAVYWLRPMQLAYADIERNRAILVAGNLAPHDAELNDRDVVARFVALETRIFDRQTGLFTTAIDAVSYDYRAAATDPAMSTAVAAELDIAGIGTQARYLPVYSILDDETRRVIVPIYGRGMWSTIYGYVSVAAEGLTIAGIAFYEHGETPGIGDRIQNPDWLAQWRGKRIYANDATVQLFFAAEDSSGPPEFRIDAITGATATVSAVERILRFWLGPQAYGPALQLIAAEVAGDGETQR